MTNSASLSADSHKQMRRRTRIRFSDSRGLVGIELCRKSPFLVPSVSLSLSRSPPHFSWSLAHVRSCLFQQRMKPHLLPSLSLSLGGVDSWLCLIAEWQDLRERSGITWSRCVCQRFTSPNPGRERPRRCRKEVLEFGKRVRREFFLRSGEEKKNLRCRER